ncbi:YdcF family protein [Bradyrhizobium sp.]|uniref:YdcF family protein n=1 Tax=Bradyrhizobium sp. TaxID=376 RepID=UPI002E063E49|nr:YdcF family protein [Bradyrhizobium sp.]
MFFFLSKTLGVILLPSNFLIGLGLVGLVLLFTRFAARGRNLVAASVVLLAICGFSPLANMLLYPLEQRFPPWDDTHGAPDGIVVLGGPIDPEHSAARGRPVFRGAVDRLIVTAALAHRYPQARIIYSGGNANLVADDAAREADYAASVFESLGIPKQRLTMERRSRNTEENAEFSKALASPKPGERWLLVTSAYHMPRSVGVFRKAGFVVEPYPADWRTGSGEILLAPSIIASDGLERLDTAIREWMGLAAYRISGKTSELLPGPVQD